MLWKFYSYRRPDNPGSSPHEILRWKISRSENAVLRSLCRDLVFGQFYSFIASTCPRFFSFCSLLVISPSSFLCLQFSILILFVLSTVLEHNFPPFASPYLPPSLSLTVPALLSSSPENIVRLHPVFTPAAIRILKKVCVRGKC